MMSNVAKKYYIFLLPDYRFVVSVETARQKMSHLIIDHISKINKAISDIKKQGMIKSYLLLIHLETLFLLGHTPLQRSHSITNCIKTNKHASNSFA